MTLPTQPYKGARDFYPEDKRLQKYIFGVIRKVVESYGFQEYDAPILEPTELYTLKTSDEIVNDQTYSFIDRGNRNVTIRPEMTPSVSRMVAARRQDLDYPLRWYSIPNLWRYERPQRGRLREHWQLNVDIFGIAGLEADAEVVRVADTIMQAFNAKRDSYIIRLNSRQLMNAFVKGVLKLDDVQATTLVRLIDKMHKMDYAEFAGQAEAIFSPSQRENEEPKLLEAYLKTEDLTELPEELRNLESVNEVRELIQQLKVTGISNVAFDPTLMRGFDYYTDIVFEVFDKHPDNNRSMFGGGRYDGLVGLFGVPPVPTVGFGMGDVTLQNFLELHELLPKLKPEADLYAVIITQSVYTQAQKIVSELREMGLNVVVGASEQKVDKQVKSAAKSGIRYALFIGSKELEKQQFVLKDLQTGSEEAHGLQRIVSIVKDFRKS